MYAQTSYGTWTNRVNNLIADFDHDVIEAFGSEGTDGFDLEAIKAEYRNALNDALPPNVNLCGSEFIGPAYPQPGEFADYPNDEYDRLDIKAVVESIDFWAIVEKHALSESVAEGPSESE